MKKRPPRPAHPPTIRKWGDHPDAYDGGDFIVVVEAENGSWPGEPLQAVGEKNARKAAKKIKPPPGHVVCIYGLVLEEVIEE